MLFSYGNSGREEKISIKKGGLGMASHSLAHNAFFNTLYKALTVLFPLFTVSYASRILGAAGIGDVSSANNIVTYFTMFASLGIPTYGVRTIAKARATNSEKSPSIVFSELLAINTLSTLISFGAYCVFIMHYGMSLLNIIFGSLIVLNFCNIEWVYQGFEEYQYIAVRSLTIKLISLIVLLVWVRDAEDLWKYAIIVCFGSAGNYILNVFRLRRFVKLQIKGLKIATHLKPIFVLFASVIAIELYSLLDVTMLTSMTSSECVGYYSNAVKIVKMVANTFTAIGAVLLPRLSFYFASRDVQKIETAITDFFRVILFIAIPSCLGLILVAEPVVYVLFGSDFANAIPTLMLLSPLIVMMPLSGGVFGQLLLTTNKEKDFLVCVIAGSVGNIILNAALIPIFAQNGAAIASVCTETIVTSMMIIKCRNLIRLKIDRKNLVSVLCASAGMFLSVFLFNIVLKKFSYGIWLIGDIFVAVIVYSIVLLMLKNDTIMQITELIKSKIFHKKGLMK